MVILGFKADYETGKRVDWVQVAPKSADMDKVQTWHRVSHLKPKENVDAQLADSDHYKAMLARWQIVSDAYNAWIKGEEIPENGIPLSAWAGVSADRVEFLKKMGIRTVEDVATMRDIDAANLPFPDSRRLPELAKAFLASRDRANDDAEKAELRERLAAMEELLSEQMAKKGPGRPKKVEEAA